MSIENCLEVYPEFASEMEPHFGLLRGFGIEEGYVRIPIAKIGAGLLAGFLLGSVTLGAVAATETVHVGGSVDDLLMNMGIQHGPLQSQGEDEDEEEEQELGDEDSEAEEPITPATNTPPMRFLTTLPK